jgi:hypothetical protein
MALDRDKFLRVAAMLGSEHAGERHAAADRTYEMLRQAKTTWFDILNERGDDQLRIATEACEALLAERGTLSARIAELETVAGDGWKTVERVMIGNHNHAAKWLIQLSDDSKIWLSAKERSFLGTCAAWIGPLRPKQQPFLQSIVDRVHQQYGFTPPP